MTTLQTGALLHHQRYRIRQPLGRGGMGAVYLAEDLNLAGRLVAVKENLNNSEDAQRQFRREAVLLAHLRHPNLPQVIDYFVDDSGRQYLIMEYVPGENMQEALASNGALPIAEALTCMDQVMQAVAYMHHQRDPATGRSRAIIHRDIKPANIKRTPEGRYLLVDFGIAKVQSTTAATAVSARALTPGYAPIEQYHGGTDERSDVYALGATLYALVTGKAPPSATNMASGAPLPPARSYNSKIPANVSKVIERAMRMAVQERYQRVTEMYTALFNRAMPTAPGTVQLAAAQRRGPRPDRTVALVVGGLATITVAAIWWLLATSSPAPTAVVPTPAQTTVTRTATPAVLAAAIAPPTIALASATPAPAATPDATIIAAPDSAALSSTALPLIEAVISEIITLPESTPAIVVTAASKPGVSLAARATSTLAPAAIPALTATRTATPAAIKPGVSLAARATSTPLPTATPAPTATRTATPAARSTSVASASSGDAPRGEGPTSARILTPPDNAASAQPILFAWEPNQPLAPGQEFEVLFWRPNEDESTGRGWVRSSTLTSVMIDPQRTPSADTYRWAVYLVGTEPYVRLRRLSEVRSFTAASPGGGSGSGGSGGGGGAEK